MTGQRDLYLRRIEEHTNTFIQLEQWFTASGQTRVTVVGPLRVKQWLKDMFQGMSSENLYLHLLGLSMLRHVQERPLTSADLEDYFRTQS
uniref:putative KHDC1-like protein isoform X2 n=1 Tax=Myodes glareolus TaxID=447135 RepID=UPI00201FB621|nr:putative KHDC1-like protein isoform X2 [Myodes glareolus]